MKNKISIYLISTIIIVILLISGFKSDTPSQDVFEIGKVYKLANGISSPITVKVSEIRGEWILIDPSYTKALDDDTITQWINTSRFSVAQSLSNN